MNRDKFEIKKIYIPLQEKNYQSGDFIVVAPVNSANTDAEWHKAEILSSEGWELVDSVPIIGSEHTSSSGQVVSYLSYPFTFGYILLFKRRIE